MLYSAMLGMWYTPDLYNCRTKKSANATPQVPSIVLYVYSVHDVESTNGVIVAWGWSTLR